METSQKNTNCESNNPIQCENIGTEEIQTILARLAALEAANESQAQRIVELEREVQQLKEQKPKKTLKKKKKKKKRGKSGYNVFMGEKMKELKGKLSKVGWDMDYGLDGAITDLKPKK